jgi:hypothetical protein
MIYVGGLIGWVEAGIVKACLQRGNIKRAAVALLPELSQLL